MPHTPCPKGGCPAKRSRVIRPLHPRGTVLRRCSRGHVFVQDPSGWNRTIYVKKG